MFGWLQILVSGASSSGQLWRNDHMVSQEAEIPGLNLNLNSTEPVFEDNPGT